jgi:hypothetical protein
MAGSFRVRMFDSGFAVNSADRSKRTAGKGLRPCHGVSRGLPLVQGATSTSTRAQGAFVSSLEALERLISQVS